VKKYIIEQLQAVGVYLVVAPLSIAALIGIIWAVNQLIE
jgi:hypothetical protein